MLPSTLCPLGMCFCPLPYVPHASPDLPWFDHPKNMWWGVQVMMLLIMSFSPVSYQFPPFRSRFLLQHLVLLHLHFVFFIVRKACSISIECVKARHNFGNGVDGRCYSGIYFKNQGVRLWTVFVWLVWYLVVALCGHSTESLGSVKDR